MTMEPDLRNFQTPGELAKVMSIGDWIITMLLLSIPLVNIIMFIVWLASPNENPNRKNYLLASLIMFGIMLGIYILLIVVFAGTMGGLLSMFD